MRLFIILGGLLIVCLMALLVGPRFVDWTNYRDAFEREASELLGRPVEVRGAVSAQLLPFPTIAFNDVVVGEENDPILTVAAFRMDAELAPFLSGEVRIFHTELTGPRLALPIERDGTVRWPIASGGLPDGLPISFEAIEVRGGEVVLADRRSDRRLVLGDIAASLSARSLQGPVTGTGTLTANGMPLRVSLSSGVAPGDGTIPIRLTAESDAANAALTLAGIASAGIDKPLLDGTLAFRTPLAPATPARDGGAASILPAIHLESALRLSSQRVALSDLRAAVGDAETPYSVTGSAFLAFAPIPHFEIDLAGQEIDLDNLAPPEGGTDAAPTLGTRVAGIEAALRRLPASPLPGRVRLALPIVTIGDTPIREVRFSGSPSATGWTIERLAGELPGRALIELSGLADLSARPGFRGSLLLAARQPASFFNWAGLGGVASLTSLERAGIEAQVDLRADTQRLDDLELDLGGRTLRGSVNRIVRPEGTVTAVDLRGGAVELDPLAALFDAAGIGGGEGERVDLQFAAGPLRYRGAEAANVEADLSYTGHSLDIGTFDVDGLAGADFHAEGTIAGLGAAPMPDLSIDIAAGDPARLLGTLRGFLPDTPLLGALAARAADWGEVRLGGTVSPVTVGGSRDLVAGLTGTLGTSDVSLRLAVENGLAAAFENGRFGLEAQLSNAEPTTLLAQLGIPTVDLGLRGPLRLDLVSSGTPTEGASVTLRAEAPASRLAFDGRAGFTAAGPRSLDGRLSLRSDDAGLWLTTLGVAAGQGLDALPADGSAMLRWFGGDWALENIDARIGGDAVSGQVSAAGGSDMIGALRLDRLSADWLSTVLTGATREGEEGDARSFAASLLPSRPFRLTLDVGGIEDMPFALSEVSATVNGNATELGVSSFRGRIGEGQVSGTGRLTNVGGLVGVEAHARLAGAALRMARATGEPLLAAGLDGSLDLRAGGQTWNELRASAEGTGEAALRDARLFGLSADLMEPVLAAADAPGFSVDEASVSRVVGEVQEERAQEEEALEAGVLQGGLRLSNGTLQIGPMEAEVEGASLTADARIALAEGALAGRIDLALGKPEDPDVVDAPDPAIAVSLDGPVAAPVVRVNVEPLTSYLASRAYQREQARVRALEEALRETVRLRREARLYAERERVRAAIRDERIEAEEASRRAEEERARAEAAERERQAAAMREAEAEAERRRREVEAASVPAPEPSPAPRSEPLPAPRVEPSAAPRPEGEPVRPFELEAPLPDLPPPASGGFRGLPGVQDPTAF